LRSISLALAPSLVTSGDAI